MVNGLPFRVCVGSVRGRGLASAGATRSRAGGLDDCVVFQRRCRRGVSRKGRGLPRQLVGGSAQGGVIRYWQWGAAGGMRTSSEAMPGLSRRSEVVLLDWREGA